MIPASSSPISLSSAPFGSFPDSWSPLTDRQVLRREVIQHVFREAQVQKLLPQLIQTHLFPLRGTPYAPPYHYLGERSYQSDTMFWGKQQNNDLFAAFSFPARGQRQRGYVAYDTLENADGYIIRTALKCKKSPAVRFYAYRRGFHYS